MHVLSCVINNKTHASILEKCMRPNYKSACVDFRKVHASKLQKRMRQFRPPSRKITVTAHDKNSISIYCKNRVCCILRIECKHRDTHRRGRCLRLTTQSLACQGHPPLRGVFPLDPFPACHPGGATGGEKQPRRGASCGSFAPKSVHVFHPFCSVWTTCFRRFGSIKCCCLDR